MCRVREILKGYCNILAAMGSKQMKHGMVSGSLPIHTAYMTSKSTV